MKHLRQSAWRDTWPYVLPALLISVVPAILGGSWAALLLLPVGLGLALLVAHSQREQKAVQAHMRLELQSWLLQQFGLPFTEDAFGHRPPSASHIGTLKSHRVLRQQLQEMPPGQHSEHYTLNATLILADEKNHYWLALYSSSSKGGRAPVVTLTQPPHFERITELRARRALFNDPKAYHAAFGQAPTRASLDAWRRQHPAQDRFERERHES